MLEEEEPTIDKVKRWSLSILCAIVMAVVILGITILLVN